MLKILRDKKTAKKVWIGLAIIIIPAFTFLGFGGGMREKKETAIIGKISGHNISNSEFKESLAAVKTLSIMQFGDKLPEIEKYLNLPAQAWERLMLLYEAKKRRINVTDKEVIAAIQSAPYFRDRSGFNNKIYMETLRYVFRLQPRVFEEQMRQSLILAKLYQQVTDKIKLNDEQIRQEYLKYNQELSIYYVASLFSGFAKKINPGETEIQTYFKENKAMFKVPPSAGKETYIPELAQIKDEVKDALINELAKKAAESKIKECAAAANKCGLKNQSTVFFKYTDQVKDLGDAGIFWENAKKLKENESSGILSNDKGYYIIKLKSVKPIDEDKFTKEKPDFSQRLLTAKKNEAFGEFTDQLKKAQ